MLAAIPVKNDALSYQAKITDTINVTTTRINDKILKKYLVFFMVFYFLFIKILFKNFKVLAYNKYK